MQSTLLAPDATIAPVNAHCHAHPDVDAITTCTRCGDFLCADCCYEGQDICPACVERGGRAGFPIHRANFTLNAVLTEAWRAFARHWLPLTAAGSAAMFLPVIVQYVVVFLVAFVMGSAGLATTDPWLSAGTSILSAGVNIVLVSFGWLGGIAVALDALEGREPSFASYFRAMRSAPIALGQTLAIYVAVFVLIIPFAVLYGLLSGWGAVDESALVIAFVVLALVLAPVVLWASLGVYFAWNELAHDPDAGFVSSIVRSWTIARGARLNMIVTGMILYFAVLLGFLLCCVGALPAAGFALTGWTALYLGLRGGVLPEPARHA